MFWQDDQGPQIQVSVSQEKRQIHQKQNEVHTAYVLHEPHEK